MRRFSALVLSVSLAGSSFFLPYSATTRAQSKNPTVAPKARDEAVPAKYAERLREFDEYVRRQMAADRTTALTIGFVKDGYVWVRGYGYADLENKLPARAESAYRLASVTKPMTAVAVMQLAERGKLNLDDEVQKHVSYFPKKKWPVTIGQLLAHLGGISHYRDFATEGHIKEHKDTRAAIAIFENFDLVAEPGTRYSYSSYGYNLLGAIIEAASGQSYADYMRENVWKPAGMSDTRMDDPLELIPNRVRGYQLVGGQLRNSEFIDISSRFAGGGTRSTVPDLLRFAVALNTGKLLAPASVARMYDTAATTAGRLTDYGLGWQTNPLNGRFLVAHGGAQNETRTTLYNFPAQNFALAAASNFESANPDAYVMRLFQILTDEPLAVSAYTGDRAKDALYRGLDDTYKWGLLHFARTAQPLSKTDAEAREAFTYFNTHMSADALAANAQEAAAKLGAGRHPAAGQPFVKVGSLMAARLAERHGPARLNAYTGSGALSFFADYIALYKSRADYPAELKFSAPVERLIEQWSRGWARSYTDEVRRHSVSSASDFDALAPALKRAFAGAEIYPNYLGDFAPAVRQLVHAGERERAFKAARLARELYPNSATANAYLAVTQLAYAEPSGARELLLKAKEIDPTGVAGPGSLNSIAYDLAANGRRDAGLELLKLAAELYPKEANLYDSIGEFYALKGQKDKAVEFYSKALEVDPNLASAKSALEKLKN
ncbi:MAG TPA: serine hydrolase [Pyrinomonadaceae bacterium]